MLYVHIPRCTHIKRKKASKKRAKKKTPRTTKTRSRKKKNQSVWRGQAFLSVPKDPPRVPSAARHQPERRVAQPSHGRRKAGAHSSVANESARVALLTRARGSVFCGGLLRGVPGAGELGTSCHLQRRARRRACRCNSLQKKR